ncbi:hypothetical protein [Streptomyces sp. PT19]|uniref:hypothetical protein n=1 Tax=Streptomyces sp. PT19 TaxID=3452239 RepID=UPI003F7FFD10
MQADSLLRRHRIGPAVAALAITVATTVVGPAASQAKALPNPCNLPGGKYVCKKAAQGVIWADENTAVLDAAKSIDSAIDFASDPLGYLEVKLRSGTKGMFSAFGEELTGKKPTEPGGSKGERD